MATSRLSRPKKVILALVGVVTVAMLTVGGFSFYLAHTFDANRQTLADTQVFPKGARPSVSVAQVKGAQNILLLGTDTRGSDTQTLNQIRGQRSDTMMLVHVPADRKHVYVTSVMRDSYVNIPGHGTSKINASLSWGGIPLTVKTVESLLNVRIDQVAIVSFDGFKDLTSTLGGVTVNNAITFKSGPYTYPKGNVTLAGNRALTYVRERHAFAIADYQRVQNQQAFMKGVVNSIISKGTLLNPAKVANTVSTVAPYLRTSEGLNAAYLAGLGMGMSQLRSADVVTFTAPTSGTGMEAGQSVVYLDGGKITALSKALRNDTVGQYLTANG